MHVQTAQCCHFFLHVLQKTLRIICWKRKNKRNIFPFLLRFVVGENISNNVNNFRLEKNNRKERAEQKRAKQIFPRSIKNWLPKNKIKK